MSRPAPGKYYIVNRVNNLTGETLALTYVNEGGVQDIAAAEFKKLTSQVWTISVATREAQRVSPQSAPDLEIGWLPEGGTEGVLRIIAARTNVWTISVAQGLSTVQDSRLTVFWGLKKAVENEIVSYGPGTGDEKQNWLLIPVDLSQAA